MTSIEQKIFNIILRKKNARIQHIASAAGVSSAYAGLVCQGLARCGHINFRRGLARLVSASAERAVISELADAPVDPIAEHVEEQETEVGEVKLPDTEEAPKVISIASFKGLAKDLRMALENAGYHTIQDVAETPLPKLMQCGMNVKQAADLLNNARAEIGMIDKGILR
jgi:DNA-binding MurR/RpiR family transcriptional regulator